jgi:hypothetical protein
VKLPVPEENKETRPQASNFPLSNKEMLPLVPEQYTIPV